MFCPMETVGSIDDVPCHYLPRRDIVCLLRPGLRRAKLFDLIFYVNLLVLFDSRAKLKSFEEKAHSLSRQVLPLSGLLYASISRKRSAGNILCESVMSRYCIQHIIWCCKRFAIARREGMKLQRPKPPFLTAQHSFPPNIFQLHPRTKVLSLLFTVLQRTLPSVWWGQTRSVMAQANYK